MTNSEVLERLKIEVGSICYEMPNTTWFVFGSAAADDPAASDIDLLVLCSGDEDAIALRRKLKNVCLRLPVHLLVVTKDESGNSTLLQVNRAAGSTRATSRSA